VSVVGSVLLLVVASGFLAATYRALHILRRDPRLRSGTRGRDLPTWVLVMAALAASAGLIGGIWLASEMQEGKQRRTDHRVGGG
jgi:hypothetical protein